MLAVRARKRTPARMVNTMFQRLIHTYPARLAFLIVAGSIALAVRQARILAGHMNHAGKTEL